MSDTQTRSELNNSFADGMTPHAADFTAIFDASFNKKDDGLDKATDTGLKIQAAVNTNQPDPQELILFYEDISSTTPDWLMRLRGQTGSGAWGFELSRGVDPGTTAPADTIADFLIDSSGNIGVGTNTPTAKLEVNGAVKIEGTLTVNDTTTLNGLTGNGTNTLSTVQVDETLNVTGATTLADLTVNGSLIANGAQNTLHDLTVNETTNLLGATTIGTSGTHANLEVNGKISTNAADNTLYDLSVSNATNLLGATTIGTSGTRADLRVYGKITTTVSGNTLHDLLVYTTAHFNGATRVGTSGTHANLEVYGNITGYVGGSTLYDLTVDHATSLNGATTIGTSGTHANLEIYGKITTHETGSALHDLSVSTTTHLTGATTIGAGLTVTDNISANGITTTGNGLFENSVGVGTTSTPGTKAKLEVYGHGTGTKSVSDYNYINHENNANHESGSANVTTGLYVENNFVCGMNLYVDSDARIKKVLNISDASQDLQTLLGIEVSNYQMKDHLKDGNRIRKKVIAQQVETVYPEAISKMTDVIPDIMKKAAVEENWVQLSTDLKAGERVKLIMEERTKICVVKAIRSDAFLVELPEEVEEVFVYGREVDDFRLVDYDAIAMLNVSATQGLYREVQQLRDIVSKLETMVFSSQLTQS